MRPCDILLSLKEEVLALIRDKSDLSGVGKKFMCNLDKKGSLIIIIHNTGFRGIYFKASPDSDTEKIVVLSDQETRKIGAILEGAYFQPIADEAIKARVSDETIIEWFKVKSNLSILDKTISEIDEFNSLPKKSPS